MRVLGSTHLYSRTGLAYPGNIILINTVARVGKNDLNRFYWRVQTSEQITYKSMWKQHISVTEILFIW